jgi:hypothetical protein
MISFKSSNKNTFTTVKFSQSTSKEHEESLNNTLQNLRWCTRSQNNINRTNYSSNKEGFPEKRFKYVNWNKKDKKWVGHIIINGKNNYIGSSDNDEELYILCLDFLYSIFKYNDFYSAQIKEDLIYYKISPDN